MGIAWQWSWPEVDARLLVSEAVISLLEQYKQKRFDVERGGQLFVDPLSATGLVLALATPPHGNDQAGRTWLELDAYRCQQEIKLANAEGLRLVGYWHTHPQKIPMISPTDIRSFSRFAARNTQQLPQPLAVIVGNADSTEAIQAWLFREGRYIRAVWSSRTAWRLRPQPQPS